MSTQSNYNPEEWRLLSNIPLLVGSTVAAAAPSGLVGTLKEGSAIVTNVMSTAKQHSNNELIQNVLPKGMESNLSSLTQTARSMIQNTEAERLQREGLEACRQASQVLARKSSPQEAEEFKLWLLEIGEGVAKSANEGGDFLNRGGVQVSPEETRVLTQIASELGVSH